MTRSSSGAPPCAVKGETSGGLPLATAQGGYGECSAVTKQSTLIVGYPQPGTQSGGGDQG